MQMKLPAQWKMFRTKGFSHRNRGLHEAEMELGLHQQDPEVFPRAALGRLAERHLCCSETPKFVY